MSLGVDQYTLVSLRVVWKGHEVMLKPEQAIDLENG